MIDARALLEDLRGLMPALEDDLRARAGEEAEVDAALRALHTAQREAKRTADAFEPWRDEWVTQVAAAWLLSLVFVRYLEDNGLIPPRLAGSGDRGRAADEYRQLYIREHPTHSDARFLRHVVFDELAALPGAREIFGAHNLAARLAPSGDMAAALLAFARRQGEAGALVHDFDGMRDDTRFLGDLYEELSEHARKRYALRQTPTFVEEFILDYTLDPAVETFGLDGLRVIDPTCGSGHFLLGAFARLLDRGQAERPGDAIEDLTQRALDSVWGVDLNPFAVAVARFRLLLAALDACGVERLAEAHAFRLNVTVADALLAAPVQAHFFAELGEASYSAEDPAAVQRTFGQRYHAVVGNPPYIRPPDAALNRLYRKHFKSCYRQYSLGVPFIEQFFALAVGGGFTGQITANSFMKREFGKKLISDVLPEFDLTHVIDTAGAYIPGHGTPTVILFGRNRRQVSDTVRSALGIRGEPSTPKLPSDGLVWRSIADHVGAPGFENGYVSVVDAPLRRYQIHPWNLQGGGAASLKDSLDRATRGVLETASVDVGFLCVTRADEAFVGDAANFSRRGVSKSYVRDFITGVHTRDWSIEQSMGILFPYDDDLTTIQADRDINLIRYLWPYRTGLWERKELGGTQREIGLEWYEWSRFIRHRMKAEMLMAYAFVSTHNHFVLDRGSKVFNRHAPVIKLPPEATEDDHLALLGLLNSSTACFWMKQVFHCKGAQGINEGGKSERWEQFYEFDSTKIRQFPVIPLAKPAAQLTRRLDALATEAAALDAGCGLTAIGRDGFESAEARRDHLGRRIALQEELDWQVYAAYGIVGASMAYDGEPPALRHGERAFEIVMARRVAAGELTTAWFERHGGTPTTTLPSHWPDAYRALVELRVDAIEGDRDTGLLEAPEHKRRWNVDDYPTVVRRNTERWLLDRLEDPRYVPQADREGPAEPPMVVDTAALAARAARDDDFGVVARVYAGRDDVDLVELVTALVTSEAVPALPALRFKATGLRRRAVWERVWDLQRREDAGETPDIPKPPKYKSADYRDPVSWKMRGPLDVPKERFNIYPYAARPGDRGVWVTWAGFDHLQRATALAALYLQRRNEDAWSAAQLTPFLAELDQLVPWLRQWHNDPDPAFDNVQMGDYYATFLEGEIHELGLTVDAVRAWRPAKTGRGRARRKTI